MAIVLLNTKFLNPKTIFKEYPDNIYLPTFNWLRWVLKRRNALEMGQNVIDTYA
jgi:hypothetical protein